MPPAADRFPDWYRSELRHLVNSRMKQLGWTAAKTAEKSSLSKTTISNLGAYDKRDANRTLRLLSQALHLTMIELQQARNADDQARAALSEWPPRVYQIAVRATQMSEQEQELLLRLTDAIVAPERDPG